MKKFELFMFHPGIIPVQVIPKVDYQFQAVAREDKGPIGGVDWNKSPIAEFRTTSLTTTPASVEITTKSHLTGRGNNSWLFLLTGIRLVERLKTSKLTIFYFCQSNHQQG